MNPSKTVLAPLATGSVTKGQTPTKGEGQKYCSECGEVINAKAEICPKCGVAQRTSLRSSPDPDLEPHRGTAVLIMGVLSLFTIPFVLGPIAWMWANEDLRKMKAGSMDPEGKGSTEAGRICGMMATILSLTALALVVLYFAMLILFCGVLIPLSAPRGVP